MLAMMMLQATVATAGQAHPLEFDLRPNITLKPCSSEPSAIQDDEILVCGRRGGNDRYRLKPLDTSRYEPKRRAETGVVGDLKGAAETERKELAPGMTSSRIMFRLKLPF